MSFPPWQVALVAVYAIALTTIAVYLLVAGDPARQPKATGQAPEFDRDGDIIAVAEQGLAEAPELADDEEAVARTVSLTDAAMDGTLVLVATDREAEPLADRIRVERLLIEIGRAVEQHRGGRDITAGAPKEWTP